ncbi:MAG: hypothetical protein JO111_00425 [Caulobacteraceae bacterium]|nr:hypothetical protein [Caulobacteraceae bacterium]
MRSGIATFALVIAASLVPLAGSAAPSPMPDTSKAATEGAVRPLSQLNLSPTKPLERPYQAIDFEPRVDKMPSSVSHQFTDGPVGSVGVICRPISHALNDTPVGATEAGQPGSESQSLGANFAYAFR